MTNRQFTTFGRTSRAFNEDSYGSQLSARGKLPRRTNQVESHDEIPLQIEEVDIERESFRNKTSRQKLFGQMINEPSQETQKMRMMGDLKKQLKAELRKQIQIMHNASKNSFAEQINSFMTSQLEQNKNELSKLLSEWGKGMTDYVNNKMEHFSKFMKQSEEKFESLTIEMGNLGGIKKSKNGGEEMKSSFAAMNSSISAGFGGDGPGSKLCNQVLFQLDAVKRDFSEVKLQVQQLAKAPKLSAQQPTIQGTLHSSKAQVQTQLILKMIKEQRKNSKIEEKIEAIENKLKELNQTSYTIEKSISDMNQQFQQAINEQMTPKIKKIEGGLIELYSRTDPAQVEKKLMGLVGSCLDKKLGETKILRVRNANSVETTKINQSRGIGEIGCKQTYLIDEQNHLMDYTGTYLLEELNGQKRRIKIQNQLLYLMKVNGLDVVS